MLPRSETLAPTRFPACFLEEASRRRLWGALSVTESLYRKVDHFLGPFEGGGTDRIDVRGKGPSGTVGGSGAERIYRYCTVFNYTQVPFSSFRISTATPLQGAAVGGVVPASRHGGGVTGAFDYGPGRYLGWLIGFSA